MKETWDVTYLQEVGRAELGQAELLEFGSADLLLFHLDRKVVLVSFGAVVVLVTTMNPFDDGLSRTPRKAATVVNSESLTSTSSGLMPICCFV